MPPHARNRLALLLGSLVIAVLVGLFLTRGILDGFERPSTSTTAGGDADAPPYASFLPLDQQTQTLPDPASRTIDLTGDGEQDVAASRGGEGDPHARMRYLWMRLRDPATGRIPDGIREAETEYARSLPKRIEKTLTWTQRGPINVGGRTRALAYDLRDPSYNTVLAAGVSGGIWRSTDGGASWTRTLSLDQRPSITSIVQDTSGGKTDVWYASTGERLGNSASGGGSAFYRGNGIYKSTDGGQSWSVLPSTVSEPTQFDSVFDYTWRVRTDPSNAAEDEVYVATSQSIVRSLDGGQSWTPVLGGGAVYPELEITSTGVAYATLSLAGANSGLYRSEDGVTWTDITPAGFPTADAQRTTIGVNPSNEDEVWFVAYAPGNGPAGDQGQGPPINHVLWKYDAETETWADFSAYLPTRGDGDVSSVGGATGDYNTQGAYDIFAKVHPDDGSKIFVGGRNLWRIDTTAAPGSADTWIGGYTETNDSFAIYEPAGSDRQHPDQHALAFRPDSGSVMLTGSDGGVHRTLDNRAAGDGGVVYESLNDGYYTTQFYEVCMNADPSDPTFMGGMQDNGTWFTQSPDPTSDWIEQFSGDGADCAITIAETRPGTARYPSAQIGQVARFDYDENGTATGAVFVYPPAATGQLFVHPFEIDPVTRTVMYYPGGSSLWRTQNVESATSLVWEEIAGAAPSGQVITALDASVQDSAHVLYYGTVDQNGGPGSVFRLPSADTVSVGSATPTDVTGPDFPAGGYVADIAVDPTDSDHVLVAFSNYNVVSLFTTSDGGETWTDVEGNLAGSSLGGGFSSGPSIRSVAILPQEGLNQTTYFVGTSVGLYSTSSLSGTGTTWLQEGPTSIGSVVVADVDARAADGQILVGTHANGTFSSSAPLPVEISRFDVISTGQDVRIEWATLSETNNAAFHVEHRTGASGFSTLRTTSGAGTTSEPQRYSVQIDDMDPGEHSFRIRQVDIDGSSSVTDDRTVMLSLEQTFALSEPAPNPFRSRTSLRLTVQQSQPVSVTVFNTLGQQVMTLFEDDLPANRPLDLDLEAASLGSGLYFVRVRAKTFSATRKAMLVR